MQADPKKKSEEVGKRKNNLPNIGIIILAAGASTRMGKPKQMLPYGEHSLLQHTVLVATASACNQVIVVLGAYAQQIKEVSQFPAQVQIAENSQWHEGMSSSIRVGVEALTSAAENVQGAVIALCDQPFISTQIINQLVEAYHFTGKPVIASEYTTTLGVPALFSRTFFPELTALKNGEGAKRVISRHSDQVLSIPFPQGAIDIDTPEDYEQFQTLYL